MRRALAVLMTVVTATVTFASPARAAYDDSFLLCTPYGVYGACVRFVDYGEGAPGGGNNDDYVLIHDYNPDGYGTKAYAWLNGTYLGWRYNGNGYAGDAVVWDPFGNVAAGDYIGLKVCLCNVANTSLNKMIQPWELETIVTNGLRVFPIYQTWGGEVGYFNSHQGTVDALDAINWARFHGFRSDSTTRSRR